MMCRFYFFIIDKFTNIFDNKLVNINEISRSNKEILSSQNDKLNNLLNRFNSYQNNTPFQNNPLLNNNPNFMNNSRDSSFYNKINITMQTENFEKKRLIRKIAILVLVVLGIFWSVNYIQNGKSETTTTQQEIAKTEQRQEIASFLKLFIASVKR